MEIDELIRLQAHTPGPWRYIIEDCGYLAGRPGVFSDDHDCGIVHWDGFWQQYWHSGREYESNYGVPFQRRGSTPEVHANARLVGASPDMLALLFKLAFHITDEALLEEIKSVIMLALCDKGDL